MMAHKDDIYSRPKRTWFATEKEKKLLAKAAKVSLSLILSSVMHFIRVLLVQTSYVSLASCFFYHFFVFILL